MRSKTHRGQPMTDVLDAGGKQLLRAKHIVGTKRWLVYGDDLDTCGAIEMKARQMESAVGTYWVTEYVAHRNRARVGSARTLAEAICMLLHKNERRLFMGEE